MYRIGTTLQNITPLKDLGLPDPYSYPIKRATRFEKASGGYVDLGWEEQSWHFGFLTQQQRNTLKAYAGLLVYISTKTNEGDWKVYTAYLHWPEEEPEHWSGYVIDLVVRFVNMTFVCNEADLP